MSSFERLDALREQNKGLLVQLSDIKARLQSLNLGSSQVGETLISDVTIKASQEPRPQTGSNETAAVTLNDRQGDVTLSDRGRTESSASGHSVSVVTLPGGGLGQARAALSKPRAQHMIELLANVDQEEAVDPETDLRRSTTSPLHFHSLDTPSTGSLMYSGLLQDQGNQRLGQAKQATTERSKPTHLFQHREERELGQVIFQDQDQDQDLNQDQDEDRERRRLHPLLGYDWIAGLLDVETSLTERSEQFFTELRNFRQVNREECVHSQSTGVGEDDLSPHNLSLSTEEMKAQLPEDVHQCTFCYRINSRLFPAPLDPQTACPVCKVPKSHHPTSEPAFIRVSIPRSALLPAHCYGAHRRLSFDPSDSLGLPSHCMSGWSNVALAEAPQFSSLDLRSCLKTDHSTAIPTAQPKQPPAAQSKQPPVRPNTDVPVSRVTLGQRSEELIDATRLAGYRFPRLAPKQTKTRRAAHPVY
ncbi:migration and invasion-inhibitory protein isoform X1 [Anguilla rostrata]|uniref:migration and invasion-inhibitory protein isoform X1 n=2 Tax=Anguilla rostrata TaxID=7938 RepID=UPI0030CF5CBD